MGCLCSLLHILSSNFSAASACSFSLLRPLSILLPLCLSLPLAVSVLGRFVLRLIIAFVFLSKYRARCRQRPRRQRQRQRRWRRRRSWRQDKPKRTCFSLKWFDHSNNNKNHRAAAAVVVVESSWKHLGLASDMKHAALQINFGLSHSERYKSHVEERKSK